MVINRRVDWGSVFCSVIERVTEWRVVVRSVDISVLYIKRYTCLLGGFTRYLPKRVPLFYSFLLTKEYSGVLRNSTQTQWSILTLMDTIHSRVFPTKDLVYMISNFVDFLGALISHGTFQILLYWESKTLAFWTPQRSTLVLNNESEVQDPERRLFYSPHRPPWL